MSTLQDLIPLIQDIEEKRKALNEAYAKIQNILREDGYSLYYEDAYNENLPLGAAEGRYCIFKLPAKEQHA